MDKIWLKNYSENIPHIIPPIDKDILDLFFESCDNFKDQTAYVNFDKKLSYSEIKKLSFQLASYLQAQDLKKGDKIAIQLPNLLQHPVSLWASIISGLTVININPVYTQRETLHLLKDSGAKAIILFSSCAKILETILQDTQIKTVIVTEPGDLLNFPKKQIVNFVFKYIQKKSKSYKIPKSISFTKALSFKSKQPPQIYRKQMEETLFIQYTGGTTGVSKGACLSQKNILSNLKQCELWLTPSLKKGEEYVLAPLPLYHIFAFLVNGLLLFLYGAKNILVSDPRQIPQLISIMKKYPLTLGVGVNTLFRALTLNPSFKNIDTSSWKFFIAGGMALESNTQKTWKKITGSPIIEGYGLTEASPVVCCNDLKNPKDQSIGLPLPSTNIRIVDLEGSELPIGQDGELEVKGPQVMRGYYNKEQENKIIFTQDGWLKTGDIASIDEGGFIYIKDRKKDMINISGFNVYPNEIEGVLTAHSKIKEAAVIGIMDEHSSESVKAFIIKNDESLSFEEIKQYCKKNLAPYKIPKKIEFVKEIPKTNIGKPLRRLLKKST